MRRREALYAVVSVPDFAVAVFEGDEQRPAATLYGEAPNQFVYAANAGARRGGVREGAAWAEARARYAASGAGEPLQAFARDEQAERRMQRRLLDLAARATPRFEDSGPGLITLDLAGLRDPHAAADELFAEVRRLGLPARIGVARNRFTALCAARLHGGVTHVYPGQESGLLQATPLEALPIGEADLRTLQRWGLRTAGELARLSEDDLVERFGERGARMARLARGEQESLLNAWRPPPDWSESRDFDWEVGDIDALSFALSEMLEKLCLRLEARRLAVGKARLSLKLAGGGVCERAVETPYPLSDPRSLLTLLRIELTAHPPGDALEGVRVSIEPVERRRVQFSLFAPELPNPERLATTLARLSALTGPDRVGAPVVPDTHRPGAAATAVFEAPEPSRAASEEELGREGTSGAESFCPPRSALVFRCYRPPRPAKAILRGTAPVYLEAEEVSGPVEARAGPWRVCGEWWTPQGWQYEEWDVEVEGRLYRVCRDRLGGEWFLAGEYD